jgi:hypothetical protein
MVTAQTPENSAPVLGHLQFQVVKQAWPVGSLAFLHVSALLLENIKGVVDEEGLAGVVGVWVVAPK